MSAPDRSIVPDLEIGIEAIVDVIPVTPAQHFLSARRSWVGSDGFIQLPSTPELPQSPDLASSTEDGSSQEYLSDSSNTSVSQVSMDRAAVEYVPTGFCKETILETILSTFRAEEADICEVDDESIHFEWEQAKRYCCEWEEFGSVFADKTDKVTEPIELKAQTLSVEVFDGQTDVSGDPVPEDSRSLVSHLSFEDRFPISPVIIVESPSLPDTEASPPFTPAYNPAFLYPETPFEQCVRLATDCRKVSYAQTSQDYWNVTALPVLSFTSLCQQYNDPRRTESASAEDGTDWNTVFDVANAFRTGISYDQSQESSNHHATFAGVSSPDPNLVSSIELERILNAFTNLDDEFDDATTHSDSSQDYFDCSA